MCKKMLLITVAFIPVLAYAEQYNFSQFRNKNTIKAVGNSLGSSSQFYIEGLFAFSPERIISQFTTSQDEKKETKDSTREIARKKKKDHKKIKHKDKNVKEQKSNKVALNQLIRNQKGLGGFTIGYRFSQQSAIEATLPILPFPLSPFNSMPTVCLKWVSPQQAGKFSFYGKAGPIIPLVYYGQDEEDSDIPPEEDTNTTSETHTISARSEKSSEKSEFKKQKHADKSSIITSETKASSNTKKSNPNQSSRLKNLFSSSKPPAKKQRKHKTSQENTQAKPLSHAPVAHSSDAKPNASDNYVQTDQTSSTSTPKWDWDIGIFVSGGVLYTLHPNVTIEGSVNVIYPFLSNAPKSKLPFGLIGWIRLGVHFKLV